MAFYHIETRKRANGTQRYRCVVRFKKNGKVVHQDSRTFDKRSNADTWGKKRLNEFEKGEFIPSYDYTLGELINAYLEDEDINASVGRTKKYALQAILEYDIAGTDLMKLEPQHIIAFCKARKTEGTSPQTISGDISFIRSVLKDAEPVFGLAVDDKCITNAYPQLHKYALIAKSNKRDRRLNGDEFDRMYAGLKAREEQRMALIPYTDLFEFSILTCMRVGEICKLCWSNLNTTRSEILVKDRKDPRRKTNNHMIVPLLGGALEIIKKQPTESNLIFPYNPRSVSAGWQHVRNALGIEDLRYHDLRREGATRLLEMGYTIEEVALVTGHRNLKILQDIYISLCPNALVQKDRQLRRQRKDIN